MHTLRMWNIASLLQWPLSAHSVSIVRTRNVLLWPVHTHTGPKILQNCLLHTRTVPAVDRRVKSICLLNVVIKQGILINTHKTKQATSCVTCNRVPFITRYCVFIQVMTKRPYTQHWQFQNYLQTRCSAIAERPRCRVRYSFRQK